ncbi:MAG: PSD1 domain-containing protein [Planctomycetes bacterium]|nr:PSD1 domain-containing protein [Planctomycetota bacterium]
MWRWLKIFLTIGFGPAVGAAQTPSRADLDFFESKVRPLVVKRCHECHSTQAKKQRGGLSLDNRAAILAGGDTGPAVVPGHPEKSLLIQAVRQSNSKLQMPRNGKLTPKEINLLEDWVRRGAPYPGPEVKVSHKNGIDWKNARKFWSFQPPAVQKLPGVKHKAWPQNRIDHFLLAQMEKRDLAPTRPADRRVLIRRATFDLIGLPPTPDEVDAFLKDRRPDAYALLVDRLLASQQYGERWARFWLDLARYCDIGEPWAEYKGQPWLYRDWVVRAFQNDLPFDQFVQKQLAADLMPNAQPRDRAALGFIGLSPQYWKELLLDKDVIKGVVAEEWEERIYTVGSTFLGLTIACARCHDHKFDPISTQDYYALAGVFASSRPADVSLLSEVETRAVKDAQAKIQDLQGRIKKASKTKESAKIAAWNAEIEKIKAATPAFARALTPGVIESSLFVKADGPNRTKLEYKPGTARDVSLQIRGNPATPGPVVPRRFLTVLSPDGKPKPFTQGSGRLELARAIVTEGAPLSARVIVNRVWQQHFGAGLVATPSDFGTQGARPSHPELLDDLTGRFLQNRWSIKWLHREIMLSAAYQQASDYDAKKQAVDPDNHLLWRMNRRRLDVEAWRDAMLAVAGNLDLKQGGPPVELNDPKNNRRTLYGKVKRRELPDLLRLFDFPDPTTHSATRVPTATPLQQLFTLNSPFLQQQASALVKRLKAEVTNQDARIRRAHELLFGRMATDQEFRLAREFLGNPPSEQAWLQYAHVLLGSNEFAFVD